MFLDSNHVLKVYFKPSRKNQDFLFLPLCSVPVWLKIRYLNASGNLHWFSIWFAEGGWNKRGGGEKKTEKKNEEEAGINLEGVGFFGETSTYTHM